MGFRSQHGLDWYGGASAWNLGSAMGILDRRHVRHLLRGLLSGLESVEGNDDGPEAAGLTGLSDSDAVPKEGRCSQWMAEKTMGRGTERQWEDPGRRFLLLLLSGHFRGRLPSVLGKFTE